MDKCKTKKAQEQREDYDEDLRLAKETSKNLYQGNSKLKAGETISKRRPW